MSSQRRRRVLTGASALFFLALAATPAAAWPPATETSSPGWTVVSRSARGVMVDLRNVKVDGAVFRVVRFHARTTLLRWHVGNIDPPRGKLVPADAGPAIDWVNEGAIGVVGVFNGGFKVDANVGGGSVDGINTSPIRRGMATVVMNALGQWEMGVWGTAGFPSPDFHWTSMRQNLGLLVANGQPTTAALSSPFMTWGDPLGHVPPEPRTGLGVDTNGNLLYVGTMTHVLAPAVARALVAAGAVTGMQLDINPFWPIVGVPTAPLRAPGPYRWNLPGSEHPPTVYNTGWQRDFFVVLAQPDNWSCWWSAPGVVPGSGARAQVMTKTCA